VMRVGELMAVSFGFRSRRRGVCRVAGSGANGWDPPGSVAAQGETSVGGVDHLSR
jgi:hypothetical protein